MAPKGLVPPEGVAPPERAAVRPLVPLLPGGCRRGSQRAVEMLPNRLVVNDHVIRDVKYFGQTLVRQSLLPVEHSPEQFHSLPG